jgi:hypothetical protein
MATLSLSNIYFAPLFIWIWLFYPAWTAIRLDGAGKTAESAVTPVMPAFPENRPGGIIFAYDFTLRYYNKPGADFQLTK